MANKLAVFSPSSNAYSETFIQSHRKLNGGNVAFYYGGLGGIKLDGSGKIQTDVGKVTWRLLGKLSKKEKLDITKGLQKSFANNKVTSILIEYGNFAAELLPYLDFFKGKIVVHFHGYDASVYKVLEDYKERYLHLFNRVDKLVVVSERMKSMMVEMGAPLSKVELNTYGPHESFFEVQPTYDSKQLVYIGRFVNKKAPYYLILMMVELVKSFPDIKLVMIGEGGLFQTVRDLIAFYGLESNVLLKGRLTRDEILKVLSDSSCYVQHSIRAMDGDMEGTPNSILEAGAAALPVVSTYHAGIPDVIVDGNTGRLVEEHDIDNMINYVRNLLLEPDKLKELGEAGRARISKCFTQKMYLDKLDSLIL